MKRMLGIGFGLGDLSKIWWIVGTAVYQFALWVVKCCQKLLALNAPGTTTEPPDANGPRKPARRPWTWNNGMTSIVRSAAVSWYVFWMFFIVLVRLRCVKGTAFGRPVVPEVCNTSAVSSGCGVSTFLLAWPANFPCSLTSNTTSLVRGSK